MSDILNADLCIIGGGAGGLSVAAGAALLGAKVILIESQKMGGDCLNTGCVPSKSLIAAARHARAVRQAKSFGIHAENITINYAQVHQHIHRVISHIAEHDSIARFTKMGVTVLQGRAQFVDAQTIVVNQQKIQAKYIIIATGSVPFIPPIPGLSETPYLTNDTIFNLTEAPRHLIVIGGGPIGCELAQAYAQLGIKVTLLEGAAILPKDDANSVDIIRQQLQKDIDLLENIAIQRIEPHADGIKVNFIQGKLARDIIGSHLLVATGRRPDIMQLNLIAAGIIYNERGIQIDERLRTTNKKVFAIGDAAGTYQFTHIANYHAGIIIKNTLFKFPAKVNYAIVPWVTYTSPELAQVGFTEQQARQRNLKIRVIEETFANNDRAQTEADTTGKIKVIANAKGKILGVTIIGPQAGELLLPWILLMQQGATLKSLTSVIVPYPTLSEISKRVAGNYYLPMLSSRWMRFIVSILKRM